MLPFLESKTISVLHFEDEAHDRLLVKKRLSHEYEIRFLGESTLRNLDMYLSPAWIDNFNVIICDYCLPDIDAGKKLLTLSRCPKMIIFYSCLTEEQFCKNVQDILGYMPFNFRFIQKSSVNQFNRMISYINCDCDLHSC